MTRELFKVTDESGTLGLACAPFPPDCSTGMRSDILSPHSPGAAANFPPTKDEQIVNSALVLFLKAVTVHFVGNANWSIQRKAFIFADKGAKVFEARVDGVLLRRCDHQITAILEVPFVRGKKEGDIQRQEAAQMTA